ncbi:DsbA family protein [Aquitalea aquatica]|uniref:DsbA family protein n=1 Tax=Aquitalea aquatica TaxID=3044273 RepID=A0A838XYR3_9NEIS|nr:DsbA family protein [Aquitalea magnusonii]MBA4707863.1 DsbA family protein [Aquitalea magnusonii]
MVKATLHYFYDPLCGWCYAASPLLQAAAAQPQLSLQLHGGGMMSGVNRQSVTPALRDYVMPHDQRIAKMTGLSFGEAYFEGLLRDSSAVFDSTPPTAAILAAEQLGLPALEMLSVLQRAHYQRGLQIAKPEVLQQLAGEVGLPAAEFAAELERQLDKVAAHTADSRLRMQQAGLSGFPSLLLEQNGQWQRVDISPWLGQPQAFVAALLGELAASGEDAALLCTPESCTPPQA